LEITDDKFGCTINKDVWCCQHTSERVNSYRAPPPPLPLASLPHLTTQEEEEEEEEEEESLFKAVAVNEEDSERDRATQV
jgi:hypothetical protein